MEPFRFHVYMCNQVKPEGVPGCAANGSEAVIAAIRKEIGKQGLDAEVQVTTCGSLGLCGRGPNMVVYPEGVWYSGVHVEDVADIVREHFGNGRAVERLLSGERSALKGEIEENKRKYLASLKAQGAAGS